VGLAALAVILAARWGTERRALRQELAWATRRFRDVAANDELTGLGNRARLLDDLEAHISRGRRYGNGFALILFDLEGEIADEEMMIAAGVLQQLARGADRCYRLGNRVISVLPEQGVPGAMVAAERGRAGLELSRGPVCSIGVAAWVPWEDDTPQDVLKRVGALARTSARQGGNRITVAEPTRA
jgi:GGDEF domain-containing protein